jgi:hypothetical protein
MFRLVLSPSIFVIIFLVTSSEGCILPSQ